MSVRSQVLNMMKELQRGTELAYVVISHDLAVIRYLADRIGVMYRGTIVELGDRESIYSSPAHPYTVRLLNAVPVIDGAPRPHEGAVTGTRPVAGRGPRLPAGRVVPPRAGRLYDDRTGTAGARRHPAGRLPFPGRR